MHFWESEYELCFTIVTEGDQCQYIAVHWMACTLSHKCNRTQQFTYKRKNQVQYCQNQLNYNSKSEVL